jgi:hypothetical protein
MSVFTRSHTRSMFPPRASMGLSALFLCLAAAGIHPVTALAADASNAADAAPAGDQSQPRKARSRKLPSLRAGALNLCKRFPWPYRS